MIKKESERLNINQRQQACSQWLSQVLASNFKLQLLAGDASFRRYYRIFTQQDTYIVMDAPPDREVLTPFIAIANMLREHGIQTPHIFSSDLQQGFVLLSDHGDRQLLAMLNRQTVDEYYAQGRDIIWQIQQCPTKFADYSLPCFSQELYCQELYLFRDWYLTKHLQLTCHPEVIDLITMVFSKIIQVMLQQPQVFVHRDFHSQNLMVPDNNQLVVLDFQDAVTGPITYDLVSLLRDCYIDWPAEQVMFWSKDYWLRLRAEGQLAKTSFDEFTAWFDWAGLQRHLKCLGIFCRLNYRDSKPRYLQFLPRLVNYILAISARYPELLKFRKFLATLNSEVL